MQEATFLILTALADGSQHGYRIMAEVEEISGGRVRLRAGTLYTALDRLRTDGLIGVDRQEIVDNRLRRYYRLTPAGASAAGSRGGPPARQRYCRPFAAQAGRRDGDMSDSLELERGYRRLLACYPPACRPEILGVLMDGARNDQRRPGLAECVDLIRGGLVLRMRPGARLPRAMQSALRIMYAGPAVSLAAVITYVVTAGRVRSAMAQRVPAQWHALLIHLIAVEVAAPVTIALWLVLAWGNGRGYDWARGTFMAFFAATTASLLLVLGSGRRGVRARRADRHRSPLAHRARGNGAHLHQGVQPVLPARACPALACRKVNTPGRRAMVRRADGRR